MLPSQYAEIVVSVYKLRVNAERIIEGLSGRIVLAVCIQSLAVTR